MRQPPYAASRSQATLREARPDGVQVAHILSNLATVGEILFDEARNPGAKPELGFAFAVPIVQEVRWVRASARGRSTNHTLDRSDFRNIVPHFTPENRKANQGVVDSLTRIAEETLATPAQVGTRNTYSASVAHVSKRGDKGMEIKRSGSLPSGKGPAEWFTGTVRIDPLYGAMTPARAAGNAVTFEPGARTAWHTHPLGQTLIVTFGCGRVQREGGQIEEIRPGDVIWFEPGEKHWHGATPTTAMTHIAIQEALDGKAVDWMEKVSDEQYQAILSRNL